MLAILSVLLFFLFFFFSFLLFFVGPGSDGIMVIWKDNFDSLYSEVAELGRCVLYADLQSCLCQNMNCSFKK